jgi:hypothetical protein
MVNQLGRLSITDVSSVDVGASGNDRLRPRALIIKRHGTTLDERTTPMETINEHFAKNDWATACRHIMHYANAGKIDPIAFQKFMDEAARQAFPIQKNWRELFLNTDIGREMTHVGVGLGSMHKFTKDAREPVVNHNNTLSHSAPHAHDHSTENFDSHVGALHGDVADMDKAYASELANMVRDYCAKNPDASSDKAYNAVLASPSGKLLLRASLDAARRKNDGRRDLTGQPTLNQKVGRPRPDLLPR